MKKEILAAALSAALLLTACSTSGVDSSSGQREEEHILTLSDQAVTLDGQALTQNAEGAVTLSNDIVYYHDNTGEDYGEGTQADMHTQEEAEAHTVVTIREAGAYRVSGTLSAGQLAVDLGDEAKRNPEAVVTLVLDGVDITCTVAPAVIFYSVYECDEAWVAYDEGETEDYSVLPADVDTSAAGANVVLADGSVNQVNGSYVARIYKEGTTKKLHKYDGAFYSKMSMNIDGEAEGTGSLSITAENEGLDSELHLTINGGQINIQAQNDGINTNEDGVSVTTINGGGLQINAGLGEEGDGIDSNGHIVINGGAVFSMASDHSPDGGLDADGEILINGEKAVFNTPFDALKAGIGMVHQEFSLIPGFSAAENILLNREPVKWNPASEIFGDRLSTLHYKEMEEQAGKERQLRDYLIRRIQEEIPHCRLNGHRERRLPGNVNFTFQGLQGEPLLLALDMKDICVSAGAACHAGSLEPSHVLTAMGLSPQEASGALRFTLSGENTREELDQVVECLKESAARLRSMSPEYEAFCTVQSEK